MSRQSKYAFVFLALSLLLPAIAFSGFGGGGPGGAKFTDPYTPPSGSLTVVGDVIASGGVIETDIWQGELAGNDHTRPMLLEAPTTGGNTGWYATATTAYWVLNAIPKMKWEDDQQNRMMELDDGGTTGNLTVTGSITTPASVSALNLQASGDLKLADSHGAIDSVNGNVHYLIHTIGNSAPDELRGLTNDGASAVAMRITAAQDFTNAGAKIASFGDNAITAYAEQAYVGFDGSIGTNTVRAFTAAGNVSVVDSAANNLSTFVDLGTTGALKVSGNQIRTQADTNSFTYSDGTNTLWTLVDDGTTGTVQVKRSQIDTVKALTSAGNVVVTDSADNTLATFTDTGTVGDFTSTRNIIAGAAGVVQTDTLKVLTGAGNESVQDSAGNGLATFVDLGTTGALKISGNEWRSNADTNSLTITDGTNTLVTVTDGGTFGNLTVGAYLLPTAGTTVPASTNPYFGYGGGGGNLAINAPSGTGLDFTVAGSAKLSIGNTGNTTMTGTLKPTSAGSGAAAITQFLKQTYVIDFPAFTAGVDQTSAQAMTGVAFGDACSVGTAADQSASIGGMSVFVTSAGNIKISISPVSTASTANPASDTFTVSCLR
jgi:hypothetical protein